VAAFLISPVRADPLADIRATAIMLTPQLATEKSKIEIAIQLRDQVHRSGIFSDSGVPNLSTADLSDWGNAYRSSFVTRTRANSCNGLAILYMLSLRSFGITSRIVTLYAKNQVSLIASSHATVDVLIDGKWVAMDPTFNVSLRDEASQHISWREAIERYRSGKVVQVADDGKPRIETKFSYYFDRLMDSSFKSLAKFAFLGPYPGGKAESLNPEWDGKIHYIDGRTWDAWASVDGSFYKNIAGVN